MNRVVTQYGQILVWRWRWVAWGVLTALGATTALLFVQPPMYQSTAVILVRTPGDVSQVRDGGDAYAQQRAKTYAVVVKSTTLASRAISHLNLDLDPETLADRIFAANRPGTALIDVSVEAPSAAEAQRTASVVLAEYADMVRGLEMVPGSVVPRAELVVVDGPRPSSRALGWGLPLKLVLLSTALAGFVAGACAAVLRETFGSSSQSRAGGSDGQHTAMDTSTVSNPPDAKVPHSRRIERGERRRRR